MRILTLLMLSLSTIPAWAGVVTQWPGAAPCNTLLQACVDAVPTGSRIELVTSESIDENISIDRSVEIVAGVGHQPRMAPGRGLEAVAAPAGGAMFRVLVSGLDFENGRIVFEEWGAGNGEFIVRDCSIHSDIAASISMVSEGGGSLSATVQNNVLSGRYATIVGARKEAGAALVRIANNRLSHQGSTNAPGIALAVEEGAALQSQIFSNWLSGGYSRGILISERGGSHDTDIVNNVVTQGRHGGLGIELAVTDGQITSNIVNNTVLEQLAGIGFTTWVEATGTGTQTAEVRSNLIAGNNWGILVTAPFVAGVTADYNLLWDNAFNSYTAGSNDFSADPMLIGSTVPYVREGSPAIDAGDTTYYGFGALFAAFPLTDAGGLARLSTVDVDVGAIEFGTHTLLVSKDDADGQRYYGFSDPWTDNNGALLPQITQVWNPEPLVAGTYNDTQVGALFTGGFWWVTNQENIAMQQGASFTFMAPLDSSDSFMHTTSGINTLDGSTQLDDAAVNSQPNELLFVTPHTNGGGGALAYTPNPINVSYSGTRWNINTSDGTNMPIGVDLMVYAQAESQAAFIATASSANTETNHFLLDHPMLNGEPCARAIITARGDGTANPHALGLWYSYEAQRWSIFNQDEVAMPLGARFNVLVDSRATYVCSDVIFEHGFND